VTPDTAAGFARLVALGVVNANAITMKFASAATVWLQLVPFVFAAFAVVTASLTISVAAGVTDTWLLCVPVPDALTPATS
jgi:hypothetical protein